MFVASLAALVSVVLAQQCTTTVTVSQTKSASRTVTLAQEYTVAPWLLNLDQTTIEKVQTFVLSSSTYKETFTFVLPAPTQAVLSFGSSGCLAPPNVKPACPSGYIPFSSGFTGSSDPGTNGVGTPVGNASPGVPINAVGSNTPGQTNNNNGNPGNPSSTGGNNQQNNGGSTPNTGNTGGSNTPNTGNTGGSNTANTGNTGNTGGNNTPNTGNNGGSNPPSTGNTGGSNTSNTGNTGNTGGSNTPNNGNSNTPGNTPGTNNPGNGNPGNNVIPPGQPGSPGNQIIVFVTTFTTNIRTTINFMETSVPVVVTSTVTTTTTKPSTTIVPGPSSSASVPNTNTPTPTPNNLTVNTPTTSNTGTSTSANPTGPSALCQATCSPAAAGATIPQPCAQLDLLNVGQDDAPYDLTQSEMLAAISFPNGLACRQNLVILMPGTGVPAIDSYSVSFIPIFAPEGIANADVMLVTVPSISLGDAQTTSEYAAFAINYAALVLNRRATMIAFSQGNLNTQWALKYWPSTRNNLRNYVAMSPDYDGTLDASVLCNPNSLLTSNVATVVQDLLANRGQTGLQSILGIGAIPTSPDAFRLYLLQLLSGRPFTSSTTTSMSATSTGTGATGLSIPGLTLPTHLAVPTGIPILNGTLGRRELQFGRHNKRQATLPGTLQYLIQNLEQPLQQAIQTLMAMPNSVLAQVLANGANLQTLTPSTLPQGCLPAIWQQVYFSNFVNTLAQDFGRGAGDVSFVPTTSLFSILDEVVQPQGSTGFENASGFLKGSNTSNILIQGNGGCPVVPSVLIAGLPDAVTHEGILYNALSVEAAVLAVQRGGVVQATDIPETIRCNLLSPRLSLQDALAQEATIPPALVRILVGGEGTAGLSAFVAQEPALKSYATRRFT